MKTHNLTDSQKELLEWLVQEVLAEKPLHSRETPPCDPGFTADRAITEDEGQGDPP